MSKSKSKSKSVSMSMSVRVARTLIRVYQLTLSSVMGGRCRYLPTCSEYASLAIERHGALRGMTMGFKRICRCHPWGGAGFDPPPPAENDAP